MNKLLLSCAAVLMLTIISCSSGGGDIAAAKTAFSNFLEATKLPENNYAAAKNFMAAQAVTELDDAGELAYQILGGLANKKWELDSTAVVEGKVMLYGKLDGQASAITMVKENEQWKMAEMSLSASFGM